MEYHYAMTIQKPISNGVATASIDGTTEITAPETYADTFHWVWDQLCERTGWPKRTGNVIFFNLAPNALA